MVVFLEDPVRCSHDVPLIIVIRLAAGGVVFEVRVSSSGFKSGFVELNVLVCYYWIVFFVNDFFYFVVVVPSTVC